MISTVQKKEKRTAPIEELSDLMSNDMFRNFYDKYFTNWDDIQTVTMMMKVYETFEKVISPQLSHLTKIEQSEILGLVTQRAINDSEMREKICDSMNAFMKGKQITFSELRIHLIEK